MAPPSPNTTGDEPPPQFITTQTEDGHADGQTSSLSTQLNSTQLNLLIYGSCKAGLNKHREHTIKHKAWKVRNTRT